MTEKSEHVDKQTMKEFLKVNKVKDEESFYAWALKDIDDRIHSGRPTYYPTLNTKHHLLGDPKVSIKTNDIESEFLKKRLELDEEELSNTRNRASRLQKTVEELQDTVEELQGTIEKLKKQNKGHKLREKKSTLKTMSSEKTISTLRSGRSHTPQKKLKRS